MRKNGFTVVELLVVIAIISVLSMIAVGQYRQSMMKANDVQRKADLNSLYKALLMVYNDTGTFPANDGINWGGELSFGGILYMKQVPEERNADLPYFVDTAELGKKMVIFSNLENPQDLEYNRLCSGCPDSNNPNCSDPNFGYQASNGIIYHYVVFSSNTSAADFPISCE